MLLAYTFLWSGQHHPQPMGKEYAKHEVDSAIELFLRGDIQEDQQARGSSQVFLCCCCISGHAERLGTMLQQQTRLMTHQLRFIHNH